MAALRSLWPLALFGIAGFLALLVLVRAGLTLPLDRAITRAIQRAAWPGLLGLMEWVSWPGYLPQCVPIGLLLAATFALARRWSEAGLLLLGLLSLALSFFLKGLVDRPRPNAALDGVVVHVTGTSSSFPSGHVLSYVTILGFLAYLAATRSRGPLHRTLPLLALGPILLVGPSRLYLGEHWFTDVAASYCLGLACLVGLIVLHRRLMSRKT